MRGQRPRAPPGHVAGGASPAPWAPGWVRPGAGAAAGTLTSASEELLLGSPKRQLRPIVSA